MGETYPFFTSELLVNRCRRRYSQLPKFCHRKSNIEAITKQALKSNRSEKKFTFTIFFWQLDEILTVVASAKLGIRLLFRRSWRKIATGKNFGSRGCNQSYGQTHEEDKVK